MSLAATKDMCFAAFQSLDDKVHGRAPRAVDHLIPDVECPLFVTWHTALHAGDPDLRGCIGCLTPLKIQHGIPKYACVAALEDTRFSPVTAKEFDKGDLLVDVSLLVRFTPCDPLDWVVGKHGITIIYEGRSSVFLPCVAEEQGWNQSTTLLHLLHKGGSYVKDITADVLKRIKCTRFESSVEHMTFAEYKQRLSSYA
ncbi:AMMECR1-domain containing protein [Giardia lamblia P15]|uniref:AMMECR1-domain containing protein n=1 Tax=Giardia intestinalis (strain P15) TaxID=658858 RepID=E1F7U9_GIAIA|nr:AMMECR1-domain containing protein [Giardia lamblia P15]